MLACSSFSVCWKKKGGGTSSTYRRAACPAARREEPDGGVRGWVERTLRRVPCSRVRRGSRYFAATTLPCMLSTSRLDWCLQWVQSTSYCYPLLAACMHACVPRYLAARVAGSADPGSLYTRPRLIAGCGGKSRKRDMGKGAPQKRARACIAREVAFVLFFPFLISVEGGARDFARRAHGPAANFMPDRTTDAVGKRGGANERLLCTPGLHVGRALSRRCATPAFCRRHSQEAAARCVHRVPSHPSVQVPPPLSSLDLLFPTSPHHLISRELLQVVDTSLPQASACSTLPAQNCPVSRDPPPEKENERERRKGWEKKKEKLVAAA